MCFPSFLQAPPQDVAMEAGNENPGGEGGKAWGFVSTTCLVNSIECVMFCESSKGSNTKNLCLVSLQGGPARTTAAPVLCLVEKNHWFLIQKKRNDHLTYKDGFYLKLPANTDSDASHLPERCLHMFPGALQKPINPHRQKLLAASKRVAKVDAVDPTKGAAKAKASSKRKAKAKAVPKVEAAGAKEMKEKAQADYSKARADFMEKFLGVYRVGFGKICTLFYRFRSLKLIAFTMRPFLHVK